MEIGGVTVFGLPADLPIWVDARVMARERIVLGGGSRSWKVLLPPAILLRIPGAAVVEGLATDPARAVRRADRRLAVSFRLVTDPTDRRPRSIQPSTRPSTRTPTRRRRAARARPARSSTRARTSSRSAARASAASGSSSSSSSCSSS